MSVFDRLKNILKNVPGVTDDGIKAWVSEAETESNLTEDENANAVYYLALALAYESIALDAARFFSYTDAEESVDKTKIFDNYMQLAANARTNFRKQARGRFGATQTHVGRADNR